MSLLRKNYQVKPNTAGYLYEDNVFKQKLTSGNYKMWDFGNKTEVLILPETPKLITITNQEVLTKDNIALRFSFNVLYRIVDGEKFLSNFSLDKQIYLIIAEAEQRLYNIVQLYIRNIIVQTDSEELNEKRAELNDFRTEGMKNDAAALGISIEQAQLRDLTFPKSIQDLFAKQLESKVRAKSELENARTVVATARALKNASELMKDDDNIRFLQLIETFTKIAEKGKNTFVIGDINQMVKNK